MDTMDLYNKWKENQDKQSFQDLYMGMKPTIEKAAKKASYGSNIPAPIHKMWAAQSFYNAVKAFNPSAGASLNTHVWNSVHQKAKRLNYMYQDLGKKPENRATMVGLYRNESANLEAELERPPTGAELADRMGTDVNTVSLLAKEVRKDLSLDQGKSEERIFETTEDEQVLSFLYYELGNEERLVYEHIFGRGGKVEARTPSGKVDYPRIARETGFSESKVRKVKAKIEDQLKKHLRR